MKKTFKLAAVAVVAALTMVACKGNTQPAEEDSLASSAIEQAADEAIVNATEVMDTVPAVAAEAATTAKKTVKAAAKKAEQKIEKKSGEAAPAAEQKVTEIKVDQQKQTAPLKRNR